MLYDDMHSLIGNTPIVKLNNIEKGSNNIFAKLELYNPLGSVKDRIGEYMIEQARLDGRLKDGATIIAPTAGNTGIGIAFGALNKGYRLIFVVPTKFSEEKQQLMKALGAEIINTPREEGMLGADKKANELLETIPDSISFDQFKDQNNPEAHYRSTGPEIYKDLRGDIDYIVLGAGSGGTFTGTVKYLKEQNPKIKAVLADPEGSIMGGGEHHDYDIEGIGNDFVPETLDMSLVDDVIKVSDTDALESVKELASSEGIIAGSSSGAAFYAAKQLAKKVSGKNIVAILPDRGDRYFSKGLWK